MVDDIKARPVVLADKANIIQIISGSRMKDPWIAPPLAYNHVGLSRRLIIRNCIFICSDAVIKVWRIALHVACLKPPVIVTSPWNDCAEPPCLIQRLRIDLVFRQNYKCYIRLLSFKYRDQLGIYVSPLMFNNVVIKINSLKTFHMPQGIADIHLLEARASVFISIVMIMRTIEKFHRYDPYIIVDYTEPNS